MVRDSNPFVVLSTANIEKDVAVATNSPDNGFFRMHACYLHVIYVHDVLFLSVDE